MATPAQIAANRRNSQKSTCPCLIRTSPRTAAGKAASSRNAVSSGLYAKALVIPGEDTAVLDALRREYRDEFQPAGPAERDLLDTLVHTEWVRRRIRLVETAAWNRYFARDRERCEKYDKPYDHIDALGEIFYSTPDRLDHMTLADLQKLQAARRGQTSSSPSSPPEIGFVPQTSPAAAPEAPTDHPQPRYNKKIRGDVAQMDRAAAS